MSDIQAKNSIMLGDRWSRLAHLRLDLPSDIEILRVPLGAIVWPSDRPPALIDATAESLLPFVDGSRTLGDLAADVAGALNVSEAQASALVMEIAEVLAPVEAWAPDAVPSQMETPSIIENSDGSRTFKSSIRISTLGETRGAIVALEEGPRSIAELVPGNTCLGQRLRNDDQLIQLCFDGPLGPFSVRTNHVNTASTLRCLGGSSDKHGAFPVRAFAVAPFAGSGPVRVYDALGRRVGRPSSDETVLASIEDAVSATVVSGSFPDACETVAAVHGRMGSVLIPREFLALPRIHRNLATVGLRASSRPIRLDPTGFAREIGWRFRNNNGEGAAREVRGIVAGWSGRGSNHPAHLLFELMFHDTVVPDRRGRSRALKALRTMVENIPVLPWTIDKDEPDLGVLRLATMLETVLESG